MELQKCVPPDERMRQSKVKEIVSRSVEAALQFLIPTLKAQHYTTNHFNSFVELGRFFWAQKPKNMAQLDQWTTLKLQKFIPQNLYPHILSQKDDFIYPHPHLLKGNFFLIYLYFIRNLRAKNDRNTIEITNLFTF